MRTANTRMVTPAFHHKNFRPPKPRLTAGYHPKYCMWGTPGWCCRGNNKGSKGRTNHRGSRCNVRLSPYSYQAVHLGIAPRNAWPPRPVGCPVPDHMLLILMAVCVQRGCYRVWNFRAPTLPLAAGANCWGLKWAGGRVLGPTETEVGRWPSNDKKTCENLRAKRPRK